MTDYFSKARHDLKITDPSTGDILGFRLRRDKDVPFWKELDGSYLVDLVGTDTPSSTFMNPERELPLGQKDWIAGYGQQYQNTSDPKRYHSSLGMDCRFSSMMIAGPTPTAITKSGWASPTGSTDPDSDWTNEANGYDESVGTYAESGSIAAGAWSHYIHYTQTATNCTGVKLDVGITSTVAQNMMDIDLYYDDTWNDLYSDDTWTKDTWMSYALAATKSVTAVRIRVQNNGAAAALARIREVDFFNEGVNPASALTAHCSFNDLEYIAFGQDLVKENTTGDGYLLVKGFYGTNETSITDLEPFQVSGTDYLFIAQGLSNNYQYMTTAEAFTTSNADNKTYQYFKWVHTTTDTLYANDAVNKIRSTINPLNGGIAWSAQTIVGAAYNNIQDLHEKSGALYIPKEDTIYYLSSAGAVQSNLAPELVTLTSSTSGQNCDIWLNNIYYPAGDQALLEIGSVNTWRTPAEYCTGLSDFNGRVFACAHDEQWLYAILDNSTKVEILAGRLEDIDGSERWVWHPIVDFTLTGCGKAWVATYFQKRLYIASTAATDALYYIPLYTGYANVTSDANRKFKTGVTAETPWLHGDFVQEDKAGLELILTMGHPYNAGRYFTVGYKKLGDSDFTNIGNYTGSATSMTQSRYLAGATTSRYSPMWKLQFTAVTDDPDYTPILLNYKLKTILFPTIRKLFYAKVIVDRYAVDEQGVPQSQHYTKQKTCLDNARSATFPVTIMHYLDDPKDGTTKYVKFLPIPQDNPRRQVLYDEKGKNVTGWEYTLLMLEAPLA